MAGRGSEADERARRLRERFAATSPDPVKPPAPRDPEKRTRLLIALVMLVGVVAYAAWKVSQGALVTGF